MIFHTSTMCSLIKDKVCKDSIGLIREFLSCSSDYYRERIMPEVLVRIRLHRYYHDQNFYRCVIHENVIMHSASIQYLKRRNMYCCNCFSHRKQISSSLSNYQLAFRSIGPVTRNQSYCDDVLSQRRMIDVDNTFHRPICVHCHLLPFEDGSVLLKLVVAD